MSIAIGSSKRASIPEYGILLRCNASFRSFSAGIRCVYCHLQPVILNTSAEPETTKPPRATTARRSSTPETVSIPNSGISAECSPGGVPVRSSCAMKVYGIVQR